MLSDYLPVLMQVLIAIGFAASMLIASVIFGKLGRRSRVKDDPYECGMLPVGEGAPRFSVKFYLVAMLFVGWRRIPISGGLLLAGLVGAVVPFGPFLVDIPLYRRLKGASGDSSG